MIRLACLAALALAGCGADGTIKRPVDMTDAELCSNAQGVLFAMRVGGAWPSAIAQAEADVAYLCRPRPRP